MKNGESNMMQIFVSILLYYLVNPVTLINKNEFKPDEHEN